MNVFRKENRRRILFSMTLMLLTAALSFGFASRAVEYLAIRQELARISEHYRPIGWLTSDDDGNVDAGAKLISESPYVETADARGFLWGTLTDLYNADLEGTAEGYAKELYGINNSEVLFWGVLERVNENWQAKRHREDEERVDATRLTFTVSERINGYPDYMPEGKEIDLIFIHEEAEEGGWEMPELTEGKRYLVRAYYSMDRNGFWNGYESWGGMQGRMLSAMPVQGNRLFMSEAEGQEALPALLSDKQLQLDELNRHAMEVIATRNMSAMPAAQDSQRRMFLTEGRWLDRIDDRTGAAVCAVHKDFAEARGLQVGDTVELTFRPAQVQAYAYAVGEQDASDWQSYETETRTYTIVGIFDYMPLNEFFHNFSEENLELYIPYGSAPEAYIQSRRTYAQNFSFVLKNPQDTDAFLDEVQGQLEAMGMRIQLLENDWEPFAVSANAMEQAARNGVLVSVIVLCLGFSLIAFLYGRQNRKSFGIARALGVSRGKCIRMCLSPMLLISVTGTGAGTLLSWRYALDKAEQTLTGMQEHTEVGLSLWWLVCLIAVPALLLSLETAAGICTIARRSVQELLRDVSGGRKLMKNAVTEQAKGAVTGVVKTEEGVRPTSAGKAALQLSLPSEAVRGRGTASVCRFILRHMRRRPVHTTLVIAVTLAFFAAITWMQTAIARDTAEVERLYGTTEVSGELVKRDFVDAGSGGAYLTQDMIDWLTGSGYLCDLYVEAGDAVRVEQQEINSLTGDILNSQVIGTMVSMRSTEDIESFCTENNVGIDYADGYGAELFTTDWLSWIPEFSRWTFKGNVPVIVPEVWLEQYDLEYGQQLIISSRSHNGNSARASFTIAGSIRHVDMGDGIYRSAWDKILIPASAWKLMKEKEDWLYSTVRFTVDPAFNRELDTVKEAIAGQLGSSRMALQDGDVMLWTGELRQVVEPFEKNLELMKLLFPVTTAVSVIAGGGLIFLLLLQRTEEAALLRVLGNSKRRTRRMLLTEPVLLSLTGLLIGICAVYCGFPEIPAAQIGMFAGAYLGGSILGAILGVVHITRKRPLELLQVKE